MILSLLLMFSLRFSHDNPKLLFAGVGRDGSRANYAGRLIFPRYPNDIRTPHLSSPRSAKRCLQITKDVIAKQKYELVLTKQQLRRATKKIKNLEQIITHLRDQALLNEDMKESLMVH